MDHRSRPLTPSALKRATFIRAQMVRDAISYAQNLVNDPRQIERADKALCRACFYAPPVVTGRAMTVHPCMACGAEQIYSSTGVDALCPDCARWHYLCKRCGCDRDLDAERADWPNLD